MEESSVEESGVEESSVKESSVKESGVEESSVEKSYGVNAWKKVRKIIKYNRGKYGQKIENEVNDFYSAIRLGVFGPF